MRSMTTSASGKSLLALISMFCAQVTSGQAFHVDLPQLAAIDDEGIHVEASTSEARVPIAIPSIDTAGARFFRLYYCRKPSEDLHIEIMAIPMRDDQLLYIDTNHNKDLRDDGPPRLFPDSSDEIEFHVSSPSDPNALSHFLLRRKPDVPDSDLTYFLDPNGNLQPRQTLFWAGVNSSPSFTGKHGTFFFDSRLSLRRGAVQIGPQKHHIGLFDYDNDGLFNGKDDMLLIDIPHPGKLEYFACSYAYDDVFELDALRFAIAKVDPYGRWVELAVTEKPLTPFQPAKTERASTESYSKTPIDEAVWGVISTSLEGETISLSQFRGQYVLLNFWGEWCKPCLDEIPVLVKATEVHTDPPLHIVGFLRSYNLNKAREIIRTRRMTWPQVIVSDSLESLLRIRGYPTNILIRPDGMYFLQSGTLQESTLEALVR